MLVIQIPADTVVHLGISIPGTIILLALAYYAVRKENKMLVYATLAAFVAGIGYLVSKLHDIYIKKDQRFEGSKNSTTLFSTQC
jgi:membrane protein DedA with SNARE-associated domain